MTALLALCGERNDLSIKEVPLNREVQGDVMAAFSAQEQTFRLGEETPFHQNWMNESKDIVTTLIPSNVTVFKDIKDSTDTSLAPFLDTDLRKTRGLAISLADDVPTRILVQLFTTSQLLRKPAWFALLLESGTYTRFMDSGFQFGDKLVCIVEDERIKFRSLHNLSRVIDTSEIFRAATDSEVVEFANDYANIIDFGDVDKFVLNSKRTARKLLAVLSGSGALKDHNAHTLKAASEGTNVKIDVNRGKILMPSTNKEITELLRFLSDGHYVGPVSGEPQISNSHRNAD